MSVVLIGCLHAFTPGSLHFFHDTFRRLSYFPITIAAILFGVRGGLIIAGLTSLAFIPHLLIFMGKSPETYLSELTEIVLYLLAGLVIGMIASKEKKLREKYKTLSEELAESYQKLHKGARTLIDVEEQLRANQKISAIGKLSASLVHEIKNPLASIRGAAEIVLDDYPAENKKRKFPEIIIKETYRLDQTVNQVLDFAKPVPIERHAIHLPLKQTVAHVLNLIGMQLKKSRIQLEHSIDDHAESFPVDNDRLSQVLMNLILNANDAIGKTGSINLIAYIKDNNLMIEITDNGPGIPTEMVENIFNPFITGKEKGNGLGLSISRKIIESQGGSLIVDVTYTDGARFIITLPPHGQTADFLKEEI